MTITNQQKFKFYEKFVFKSLMIKFAKLVSTHSSEEDCQGIEVQRLNLFLQWEKQFLKPQKRI